MDFRITKEGILIGILNEYFRIRYGTLIGAVLCGLFVYFKWR